jgi:hypothetical protein
MGHRASRRYNIVRKFLGISMISEKTIVEDKLRHYLVRVYCFSFIEICVVLVRTPHRNRISLSLGRGCAGGAMREWKQREDRSHTDLSSTIP